MRDDIAVLAHKWFDYQTIVNSLILRRISVYGAKLGAATDGYVSEIEDTLMYISPQDYQGKEDITKRLTSYATTYSSALAEKNSVLVARVEGDNAIRITVGRWYEDRSKAMSLANKLGNRFILNVEKDVYHLVEKGENKPVEGF